MKTNRVPPNDLASLVIQNQTTLSMAIYYGMFEEDELPYAYKRLVQIIHHSADRMDFGILGNRAIFRVLAESGQIELALSMMLNPSFPSFQYWIDRGATALFEMFYLLEHRIDSLEDEPIPPRPDSLNHHMWGDIIAVFMRHLAGIQVESPTRVTIAPCFTDRINNLCAYETVLGKQISVKYKKIDIMVDLTVSLPQGVEATVTVPAGYRLAHGKSKCKAGENHLIFCKQ